MAATVTQCVVRIGDPATGVQSVGGRSLLGWLLREFTRFGVTDFLLLGDRMPSVNELVLPRPARITLLHTPVTTSAADALLDASDQLQQRFVFCDGCLPFDWNFADLLANAAADDTGKIGWLAQPLGGQMTAVFSKSLVEYLHPGCSLGTDVLPELAKLGRLGTDDPWGSSRAAPLSAVGDLPDAGLQSARLRRKALFLDRDGVLNIDHGYVGSRERFEWVEGALDAIQHATRTGWHVFIVTNQSGVARGFYTEDEVRELLDWIGDQARATGGTVDDVRYCPFHPEAELDAYRQAHPWRKPMPGMLLDLITAWELDPGQAVMIGDQETDMRAAAAAGVAGYLFPGGNLLAFLRPILDRHERPGSA